MKNRTLVENEFLKRVKKSPACWEWLGYRMANGYGSVTTKGNGTLLAHRLAHELYVGPIPAGTYVLHRCDNRGCCNPKHLWLGTQSDNMRDKQKKGRAQSKLTAEQVLSIREDGRTQMQLASIYGVHQTTISLIKCRKKWNHI